MEGKSGKFCQMSLIFYLYFYINGSKSEIGTDCTRVNCGKLFRAYATAAIGKLIVQQIEKDYRMVTTHRIRQSASKPPFGGRFRDYNHVGASLRYSPLPLGNECFIGIKDS